MTARLLVAFLLAGCARRPCAAAHEARADDAVVSGATVDALIAALEAQPFGSVPVRWRDGAETSATATIEVVRGTGVRGQRADCLPECHTRYRLATECGPDTLSVEARGTVSTADGRVRESWSGTVAVTALHGPVDWRVSSEPIAVAELAGTLDPLALHDLRHGARAVGVRAHLSGADGVLTRVSFDLAFATGEIEGRYNGVAALGSAPRPESPQDPPPQPE